MSDKPTLAERMCEADSRLDAFAAEVAALERELAEARQREALKSRVIERLPLCPDHRDKIRDRCVECDRERAVKQLADRRDGDAALVAGINLWMPSDGDDPRQWEFGDLVRCVIAATVLLRDLRARLEDRR